MLRDWTYVSKEMHEVLNQFEGIDSSDAQITSYKLLSPDSFLWRLKIGKRVYYLYAEDYIPSMDHVRKQLEDFTHGTSGEFVMAKKPDTFEEHAPVKSAVTYKEPEDWPEVSKYSVGSEYDSVFLFRVSANTTSKKSISG